VAKRFLGRALRFRGRIGEREDHRPLGVASHLLEDLGVEQTAHRGHPDQHGGPGVAQYVPSRDSRGIRQLPSGHGVARLRVRALLLGERGVALDQQPLLVDREDATARLARAQAAVDQDPSMFMAAPTPACPKPTTTNRCSERGTFWIRDAVSSDAQAVAPVPWMSSSNESTRSR